MRPLHIALMATTSLLLMSSASQAAVTIDGTISSGEYTNAIVINTPYNPASDVTLATFSDGNELVAETTYFQKDPNGKGFDFAVQTDPNQGHDNADASVGLQFTNLYLGDANGAQVVFELGNQDAFNLNDNQKVTYSDTALGIEYADVAGTTYANGGFSSVSETYIPYAAYNTIRTDLGLAPVAAGDDIEARDLQAFSYGGNNAGGGTRFGSIEVPSLTSAVPEPGVWMMLLAGIGMIGFALRRQRKNVSHGFDAAAY